jgi:hypothetical protein
MCCMEQQSPWEKESMNLLLLPLRGDVGAPACPYGSVGDDRPATRTYAYIGSRMSLGRLIFGSVLAWLMASEVVIWAAVRGRS